MKRGGARELNGHLYARARFGDNERIERRVPWAKSLEQARERGELMGEILSSLVAAGRRDLVKAIATKLAEAPTKERLGVIERAVAAILKGAIRAGAARDITIRQWGERYTSGELARTYPDHVRAKDYEDDASRLRLYVYPHVGDVPVVAFTVAHADLVMSKIPRDKVRTPAARRHVAQVLGRLLNLAVMPGRLLPATPLPRGWLPKIPKGRHYSCLWPKEEAALLACADVELAFRLFCGVLNREGMRVSELWDSAWWQWNLEAGTFLATKTKTDDPRMWALNPGVVRAMKRWKEITTGAPDARPFEALDSLDKTHLADTFRGALKLAGVERQELFTKTEHTARLRAHDMRATFVTLSLAEGRTETWVRDRTAHKTTTMIDRYRRLARQVAELELGSLVDLEAALDASFRAVEVAPGESPGEGSPSGTPDVGEILNGTEGGTRTLTPNGRRILNRPQRDRRPPSSSVSRGKPTVGGSRKGASPGLPPPPEPPSRGRSPRVRSVARPDAQPTSADAGAHAGRPGPARARVPTVGDVPPSARPVVAAAQGLAVQRATWDDFDALERAVLEDDNGGRS